jgi:hypothetical protein
VVFRFGAPDGLSRVAAYLDREVLYKSLGKTPRVGSGLANLFQMKLIQLNQLFGVCILYCETRFFIPQPEQLCLAARFFTTQKNFSHREMGGRAKKNRRRSVGFLFEACRDRSGCA